MYFAKEGNCKFFSSFVDGAEPEQNTFQKEGVFVFLQYD